MNNFFDARIREIIVMHEVAMPDRFENHTQGAFGALASLIRHTATSETPALLPVVNLNLMLIPPIEMRQFGAEALMTNAYIIYRSSRLREAALSMGIHSCSDLTGR